MKIELTEGERKRIVFAVKDSIEKGGMDMLCDPFKLINKMKIKEKCQCCGK